MNQLPEDPSPKSGSFEHLLGDLEAIIERIESGEIGLERSIGEYERGVQLIRRCREILSSAEQKVEELSRALSPGGPSQTDERSTGASRGSSR
jgi:exodeoxyribonuclease VII small subunit